MTINPLSAPFSLHLSNPPSHYNTLERGNSFAKELNLDFVRPQLTA
jgi:hypothetical protein